MTDKQRLKAEIDLLQRQLLFIEKSEQMNNPIPKEPDMVEDNIIVPRWFLEVVEDALRIQNNINEGHIRKTGETCQDRNIKQSLIGVRKLLNGQELSGLERSERL